MPVGVLVNGVQNWSCESFWWAWSGAGRKREGGEWEREKGKKREKDRERERAKVREKGGWRVDRGSADKNLAEEKTEAET